MKFKITYLVVLLSICYSKYALGQNFTEFLQSSGVYIQNPSTDFLGSGLSFYDINQDGWDDLTFGVENDTQVVLFNNMGILEQAPFKFYIPGEVKMTLWVDYDNDNDLDFFVSTQHGRIYLWNNDGNFNFSDYTINAGLPTFSAANFGASFGDYDLDGDLDFYLCRYNGQGDSTDLLMTNNLYRNNGNGTFTDVTWAAGVSDGIRPSFLSVWYDYNSDGWSDLFVINDRNLFNSSLYRNNQDGTFTDMANFAGIQMSNDNPMAGSFGDFDNDMDLDLFVGNTSTSTFFNDTPRFFVNNNDGTFNDERSSFNLELPETTWGGLWFDYDNDTDLDLYVATDYLDNTWAPVRNYFLVNEYPNAFVDDSSKILGSDVGSSHAVARGDINRDGFYDIAVHVDSPSYSSLWLNSGNANNYVRITPHGVYSNSMAIGTWIHVYVQDHVYTQYTHCGENFIGQNSQHHIIGLGSAINIDSIHVIYPSGILDRYYDLSINDSYHLYEGETVNFMEVIVNGDSTICPYDSVMLSAPELASYLWSTGDTTQSIFVSNSGLYSVQGKDSIGQNWQSFAAAIEVLPNIHIEASIQELVCANDSSGEVVLAVDNGGFDYNILWSNGETGDSLVDVSEGEYSFYYSDANLCNYADTFELNQPFPLNLQVAVSPQTPEVFGSISVLVNGGTPPYLFVLDEDTLINSMDSLTAQTYYLAVYDANQCAILDSIAVPFRENEDSVINSVLSSQESAFLVRNMPDEQKVILTIGDQRGGYFSVDWFETSGRNLESEEVFFRMNQDTYVLQYPVDVSFGIYFLRISYHGFSETFPIFNSID